MVRKKEDKEPSQLEQKRKAIGDGHGQGFEHSRFTK